MALSGEAPSRVVPNCFEFLMPNRFQYGAIKIADWGLRAISLLLIFLYDASHVLPEPIFRRIPSRTSPSLVVVCCA